MRELIIIATPEAAQGRGLQNVYALLESYGLTSERILRGTGDGGMREFHSVAVPDELVETLLTQLNTDPDVSGAYASPQDAPPPLSPTNYRTFQTYLDAAPGGVDADYIHSLPGGKGANVKLIDLEYNANLNHEEFAGQVTLAGGNPNARPVDFGPDHGTAVLGVIKAQHTGSGVNGIAPDANVRFYSTFNAAGVNSTATAIQAAADLLGAGDIMLLELQAAGPRFNYTSTENQRGLIPAEWFPAQYEAIKYATNKGIVVVEAAGNGAENLDDAIYDTGPSGAGAFPSWWINPFRRTTLDSGAIIVGAGAPPVGTHGTTTAVGRSRNTTSNYGSCVDVQAWGANVTTAGYGTLWEGGGDPNQWYAKGFSGTSSASAIVAGSLTALQGALKAKGRLIRSFRSALRATGGLQQEGTNPASQRIGNQIDLKALAVYHGIAPPVDSPPIVVIPNPIDRPKRSFSLRIYDKLGQRNKATYTAAEPGGVVDGFVSRMNPNGTCGAMTFNAVPKFVDIENGDILYLSYNTGAKVIPVHMGVVTHAPDKRSEDRGEYEVASGKKLLERATTWPNAFFLRTGNPADASGLLLDSGVNGEYNPALKWRYQNFPLVGLLIDGGDLRLQNTFDVFNEILEKAPEITDADWGTDTQGAVVVRRPSGVIRLPYSQVRAQFGTIISAEDVVTKAIIKVANAVSNGAITSPSYRPSVIAHTYEHPEHASWKAPRVFQIEADKEGRAVIDLLEWTPRDGFGWDTTHWTTVPAGQQGDLGDILQDGSLTTKAISAGVTSIYLNTRSDDTNAKRFVGFNVSGNFAAGTYDVRVVISYRVDPPNTNPAVTLATATFDLNELKGRGDVEARYIAPVHWDVAVNDVSVDFYATSTSSLAGLITLLEFRALQTNRTLLEQIARAQIKLPAKELSEVTISLNETNLYDYLLETPAKTLTLEGGPDGTTSGTIAETVITANTEEGLKVTIALGSKIRNPIVRAITEAIKNARGK